MKAKENKKIGALNDNELKERLKRYLLDRNARAVLTHGAYSIFAIDADQGTCRRRQYIVLNELTYVIEHYCTGVPSAVYYAHRASDYMSRKRYIQVTAYDYMSGRGGDSATVSVLPTQEEDSDSGDVEPDKKIISPDFTRGENKDVTIDTNDDDIKH